MFHQKKQSSSLRVLGIALASSVMMAAAAPLQAQSACKGLEKAPCEKKEACTWVDGYTRKDGAKVSAYCRAKGGKKKTTN